jgi:hypothetical protein
MSYFKSIPKVLYSFDFVNDSAVAVSNIFSRFKVKQEVLNNAYAFYKFQLEDGDTPEIVAFQEYGDSKLHWIICMVNELEDPLFDFPLPINALENRIVKQYNYNTIDEAYSDIHHYELVIEKTLNEVDGLTTVDTSRNIVTLEQYNYRTENLELKVLNSPTIETTVFRANNSDPNSTIVATLTIKSTYRPVYVYNHEDELNETKRQIKMLKPEYVQAITSELQTILNG